MRTVRDTKRAGPHAARRAQRRDRRLHQRRQVVACSTGSPAPACWSRTRCSPPSTRPPGGPARRTGGSTRCPTRSASSGTCRTSSSRRSAPRWRRSPQADLVVHVVDGAHPDPEEQVRAVREVLAEVGADGGRPSCSWSTRPTRPTRRRCCGSSGSGRTRSSSPPAPGPAWTSSAERIEARLPRPAVELDVLVPYDRGDLVARCTSGARCSSEHTGERHCAAGTGR